MASASTEMDGNYPESSDGVPVQQLSPPHLKPAPPGDGASLCEPSCECSRGAHGCGCIAHAFLGPPGVATATVQGLERQHGDRHIFGSRVW